MQNETYDVVVVGSGAAGAMAALRAKELGLSVLIVEKAHKFGGTSATSGGVLWVPNHGLTDNGDSRESRCATSTVWSRARSSASASKPSWIRHHRWCDS